jgi:cytochrome c oxidase subunit 2
MAGEVVPMSTPLADVVLAGTGGAIRNPAEVFGEIFWVFLGLGTAVGIVVIGYTLYNTYKYRDGEGKGVDADVERPELGELPSGSGGGKKLALSFSISAVIVIGLIIWTYSTLLYVEDPPDTEEQMEITVVGQQFGWQFEYPNGETTPTLHAPTDRLVWLNVTSQDVFHNYGIPGLRTKTDAIPGQMSRTWFYADEPANYTAVCYELCGAGHSGMRGDVVIHNESAFEAWYASTNETSSAADAPANNETNAAITAPAIAGDRP